MNIAIMGATSHIAKGLIDRFLHKGDDYIYLFGRTADKIQHFLAAIGRTVNLTRAKRLPHEHGVPAPAAYSARTRSRSSGVSTPGAGVPAVTSTAIR